MDECQSFDFVASYCFVRRRISKENQFKAKKKMQQNWSPTCESMNKGDDL